jgi:NAD+ synthetase
MNIVMAQCNFKVGDFAGNTQKILDLMTEWGNTSDMIVFSELSVSGYYPMDLLDRPEFIIQQNEALQVIKKATLSCKSAVVIGAVTQNQWSGKPLNNALIVYQGGVEQFVYHKKLLPTYNIFDEARHFEPGMLPGTWLYQGCRVGFLICEDGWFNTQDPNYKSDPVDALSREQLDVVISINASPSNEEKVAERVSYVSNISRRCNAPVFYVNQVGGNDEIVFDGGSFAINAQGDVVQMLESFAEDVAQLSLDDINNLPVRPLLKTRPSALYFKQLVLGVRDYVEKCGFSSVLVGASGGIDSAVTLALAVEALGANAVIGITMPTRFSSKGSVADSFELCEALGVECKEVSIESEFAIGIERFEQAFGEPPSGLTMENMQARIRGKLLMAYSNHFGNFVLSTGNKTEMSVGYATLYGDMNGGLNALGDLYKMEVYALAEYINERAGVDIIPRKIIDKAPSAELSEGQKDEDSLPAYPQLDAIVRLAIERDLMSAVDIERDELQVASLEPSVVTSILRKMDVAEFKRRQAPPIVRVHKRSFGIGRRLPIAQGLGA